MGQQAAKRTVSKNSKMFSGSNFAWWWFVLSRNML
jgi:hypothetical protein